MEPSPPDAAPPLRRPRRSLPLLHRAGEADERHYRLRPLTGEFEDPSIEADFEASRSAAQHRRADLAAALGTIVVLLVGVEDALSGHGSEGPLHLLLRALTIAPLVARVHRWRVSAERTRTDAFPFPATTAAAAWILAGLILHMALSERSEPLDLAVLCIAILLLHLVVPNRVRLLTPVTGLAAVAFAATSALHPGLAMAERVGGAGVVILAWVSAVSFHRELEVLRREEFIALRRAAEYNDRLEAAVARSHELESELRRQANVDPLTAVGNRRWFFAQLDLEFARARRTGRPLALMILDADHFKVVNDTHGHAAGDRVLQHLAAVVRASLRSTDLLARIGGEEFAVLMPETDGPVAHEIGERVRRAVAAEPVLVPTGVIAVTASAGVTVCRPGAEDPRHAVARADANLYDAKEAGRDAVVTR